MTYGWAILIIAVVLAALFELGVFNPMTFASKASPGSCQVVRPEGAGTTDLISLSGECNGELPQYVAQFNGQSSDIIIRTHSLLSQLYCNITLSAWSYDAGMSSNVHGGVVGFPSGGGSNSGWDDIEYNNSVLRFELRNESTGNGWLVYKNFYGKWVFTALVLNNGHPTGYIDGVDYHGGANYIGCISDFSDLQIGVWDRHFNGSIANVQIYNTALSSNDIQALYHEGIGGAPIKIQSLIAWYPLNGNANDYSGNGNNGVPSGITYTSNWYSGYSAP